MPGEKTEDVLSPINDPSTGLVKEEEGLKKRRRGEQIGWQVQALFEQDRIIYSAQAANLTWALARWSPFRKTF